LLEVLYHDDALIALSKPAGRIVVPGRGGAAQSAVDRPLSEQLAEQLGRRVYVVHRLDRGTSGALLFALTAEAHRALSMAFERHQVDKRYWALCRGTLLGSGEVVRALIPIRGGKVRAAREGEAGGKPSATAWRALERWSAGAPPGPNAGYSAVEFRPRSGRLHQVRVHAALLGHPLAVDPYYGGAEALFARDLDPRAAAASAAAAQGGQAEARPETTEVGEGDQPVVARLTLHASSLRLAHPASGAPLEITAALPADLERAVTILRAAG
jgi:23S rRNA-/tRNA-specific pseudouridylate synthase